MSAEVLEIEDDEEVEKDENPENEDLFDLEEDSQNGNEENEDRSNEVEIAEAHSETKRATSRTSSPLDIPIAVVRRLMKGAAAPGKRFTPELLVAISRCAGIFGLYLLSSVQEAAVDANRTTIRPVEVIEGLISCGFPELAEEARISLGLGELSRTRKMKKKIGK